MSLLSLCCPVAYGMVPPTLRLFLPQPNVGILLQVFLVPGSQETLNLDKLTALLTSTLGVVPAQTLGICGLNSQLLATAALHAVVFCLDLGFCRSIISLTCLLPFR